MLSNLVKIIFGMPLFSFEGLFHSGEISGVIVNSVVWKGGALFICHNDGNSVVVRDGKDWVVKGGLSVDDYMKKQRPEGCVGSIEVSSAGHFL